MVIPPTFEFAWQFSEGHASAWLNGRAGFIDRTGKFVISPAVRVDGRWGFIDKRGILVIPAQYRSPSTFRNGRAHVTLDTQPFVIDRNGDPASPDDLMPEQRDGKWGFITADGRVAVECEFDAVHPFSEGLAAVRLRERWGFVNRRGQVVITPQFEDAWSGKKGWGYIHRTGRVIWPWE